MPTRLILGAAALAQPLAAQAIVAQAIAAQDTQSAALPASPAVERVLEGDNIVTLIVNGQPLRLEVSAERFGPPVINPDVAARLLLVPETRRGWRFGPVVVDGEAATAAADWGAGPVPLTIAWSDRPASGKADGVIGVHHLPEQRVTFILGPAADGEARVRFPLVRAGGRSNLRVGTEVVVGKKRLTMIFVPERPQNLITAPTANFIATHQEGGFEPASDGSVTMDFGVLRPTRMMRIAEPIMLGPLAVERFAVRVEDYGEPKRVGEIGPGDPRFEKGHILVSRRKGRGKPDLLTRIGRDQIAHCSAITYDFAAAEISLSCAAPPPSPVD